MVAFYIAVVCTFVLMFWLCLYVFEVNNGPKLDEQVTVKRRNHTPARLTYSGETMLSAPPAWSLTVANKNGSGMVQVSQKIYENVEVGDIIRVKGTRGCSL